jgi:pyruvate-formate lyase-activating enzyme
MPGEFHPIIAYLFTEWNCNLDCHYCWAFDNTVKGMTEDTARRSIDWLRDTGCRVLALMGGEVLLRPHFVHKVVYYAAQKGFWVYVPTTDGYAQVVIDRLGEPAWPPSIWLWTVESARIAEALIRSAPISTTWS